LDAFSPERFFSGQWQPINSRSLAQQGSLTRTQPIVDVDNNDPGLAHVQTQRPFGSEVTEDEAAA
jgi:hypothetical protein